MIDGGWRCKQHTDGGWWWHYKGVGQGYRIETAWKKMKAQSKQSFEQFYGCTREEAAADIAKRNRQLEIAAARDAVIRAAKAWVNWEPVSGGTFDVRCRNLEKQNMLIRRLNKAVARLEKLEGK